MSSKTCWYRCRKCRTFLFTNQHLENPNNDNEELGLDLEHRNEHVEVESGNDNEGDEEAKASVITGNKELDDSKTSETGESCQELLTDSYQTVLKGTLDCVEKTLYCLKLENCPLWISKLIEKGQFLKGKLNCPKCNGRLGAFDFISKNNCECGNVNHPIHVTKSKIDELQQSTKPNIRIPKLRQTNGQIASVPEETKDGLLAEDSANSQDGFDNQNSGGDDENEKQAITEPHSDDRNVSSTQKQDSNNMKSNKKSSRKDRRDSQPTKQIEKSEETTEEILREKDEDVDAYTCSVCLDIYYQPYTCKPCAHVFCGPCLRRLASGHPENTKCPLCREKIIVCLPNNDVARIVKRDFPLDWIERRIFEKKFQRKLPALPKASSRNTRRTRTAQQTLSQWAGVMFVCLMIMLSIIIFMTVMSFVLWFLWEQCVDVVIDTILAINDLFDKVWEVGIMAFLEGKITPGMAKVLIGSVAQVVNGFAKIFNKTSTAIQTFQTLNAGNMGYNAELPAKASGNQIQYKLPEAFQVDVLNFVLISGFIAFIIYKFAKHRQAQIVRQ